MFKVYKYSSSLCFVNANLTSPDIDVANCPKVDGISVPKIRAGDG